MSITLLNISTKKIISTASMVQDIKFYSKLIYILVYRIYSSTSTPIVHVDD